MHRMHRIMANYTNNSLMSRSASQCVRAKSPHDQNIECVKSDINLKAFSHKSRNRTICVQFELETIFLFASNQIGLNV